MDNEGEEDTRGRLRSSLSVSPSIPDPSEGVERQGGEGARVKQLLTWMSGTAGVSAVGPVGTPGWRLDDLLHSA